MLAIATGATIALMIDFRQSGAASAIYAGVCWAAQIFGHYGLTSPSLLLLPGLAVLLIAVLCLLVLKPVTIIGGIFRGVALMTIAITIVPVPAQTVDNY